MRLTDPRQLTHVGLTAVMAVMAVAVVAWPAHAKKRGPGRAAGAAVEAPRVINRARSEEPAEAPAPSPAEAGQNAAEAMQSAEAKAASEKGAATPAPTPGTAAVSNDLPKAKMGDQPNAVKQTSYGQPGKTARPGRPDEARLPPPEWMTVFCEAGCNSARGQVVLDVPINPTLHIAQQSPEMMKAASVTDTIVCMGGCFGSDNIIAGVPGQMDTSDTTTKVAGGKVKTLNAKQQAGDWMTRINRERGDEPAPGAASEEE
jgi:hypothetical protein